MNFPYYYCEKEKEGGGGGFVDIVYGICLSSFLIFLRCWYLILGLFVHLAVMGGVHTDSAWHRLILLLKPKLLAPCPLHLCTTMYVVRYEKEIIVFIATKVLLKTYHNI